MAAFRRAAEIHYHSALIIWFYERAVNGHSRQKVSLIVICFEFRQRGLVPADCGINLRESGRTTFSEVQLLEEITDSAIAVEAVDDAFLSKNIIRNRRHWSFKTENFYALRIDSDFNRIGTS